MINGWKASLRNLSIKKNVIKTAEMPGQAVWTAIIGMISAKACLVTFSIIRPEMDREALVNTDKLYKKWRKSENLSKFLLVPALA